MKKLSKLFIVIGVVLGLTGCGNKEFMTADAFQGTMSKNYSVVDATSQAPSSVKKAVIAVAKDSKYQIEFYEFDSKAEAVRVYETNKENFLSVESSTTTKTEKNIGNYSKFTYTTSEEYMVLSRIEHTLVYLRVDKNYKKEINDLLKELGY